MKLSVIFPTINPKHAEATAASLYMALASVPGMEYEIVACSPERIEGPNVVHLPDPEPKGSISANIRAYAAATGDFIMNLSDDVQLHPLAIRDALSFLLLREAIEGRRPILSGFHWVFGDDERGMIGTVWGRYYPYYFVMRRDDNLGFFSPEYVAHFADPDLAMRVYEAGGSCHLSPGIILRVPAPDGPHKVSARDRDQATFQAKWGEKYGAGWGREFREFNVDLTPSDPMHGRAIVFDKPDMLAPIVQDMLRKKAA